MLRIYCVVIAILLCYANVGCKKAAQEAMERAIETQIAEGGGKAKVELGDDKVSLELEGEDGSKQIINYGEGTKIPDDFPKDIPLYPTMTVNMVQSQVENAMYMISATTPDSLDAVTKHYDTKVKPEGWSEQTSLNQGAEMTMRSYEKEGRMLQVTLVSDGKETTISLISSKKN